MTTPAKKAAAPAPKPDADPDAEFWSRLTAPFPADQIEKLPKNVKRDDQDRGVCAQGTRYSADGIYCGKFHARAVHLDYVGHAGITMRLNEVCGPAGWDWEPLVYDEQGFPVFSGQEFWITLQIRTPSGALVVKKGVADDFNRSSKQAIGDGIRNAAMRFGIATYLWSKSDAAAAQAEHVAPDLEGGAKALWARALTARDFGQIKTLWAQADADGLLDQEVSLMDGDPEPLGTALVALGNRLRDEQDTAS